MAEAHPTRAFIGWDLDDLPAEVLDETFPTWQEAVEALRMHVTTGGFDDCEACAQDAAETLDGLDALAAGDDFDGFIDGNHYILRQEPAREHSADAPGA